MKKSTLKKLVSFILITAIAIQGSQANSISKAASNNLIYLFGIHEFKNGVDKGHSDFCNWMSGSEKYFKTHDNSVTVGKRHYAGKGALYSAMKKANYLMLSCHGGVGFVCLNSKDGTRSDLTSKIIEEGPSLNQLKVCHVTACNSYDTARVIQKKGARTTIGYASIQYLGSNKVLQAHFNLHFSEGYSVENAHYLARVAVYNTYPGDETYKKIENYHIFGDKKQVYN